MIRVVTSGKNPMMRYRARTHRVFVAWLHDVCQMKEIRMVYEEASRMCADIFTQAFSDAVAWRHACGLIQIVDPAALVTYVRSSDLAHQPPKRSSLERRGGRPTAMRPTLMRCYLRFRGARMMEWIA